MSNCEWRQHRNDDGSSRKKKNIYYVNRDKGRQLMAVTQTNENHRVLNTILAIFAVTAFSLFAGLHRLF